MRIPQRAPSFAKSRGSSMFQEGLQRRKLGNKYLHPSTRRLAHLVGASRLEWSLRHIVLDKGFVTAPSAPRPSQTKISLGSKKAADSRAASDPSEQAIPVAVPTKADTVSTSIADLQITRASIKRGNEKTAPRVPILEPIMNWSTDQLGEKIAEDILRHLRTLCRKRSSLSENKFAAKDERIQDLESKLTAAKNKATGFEREVVLAKQAAEEAANRMKDVNSLARFLC
nr:uncharacterized protein LOC109173786 [Ipomoea batatas]